MDEVIEIKKEKAIKAKVPERDTAGMTNQKVLIPLKAKSKILNPGTASVTI